MNAPCGCCENIEILTPVMTANRPGLNGLAYRVGTHATFLETMKARLSSSDFPELGGLTTREADDPAIALLDTWATVADVLTFYQERLANEGYLRTATERRSILELARLVGYALRPGVAASVYLAFTLEKNYKVEIPFGARAQSLPGPGELPQSFETSEKLEAHAEWNNLKPRMTRPQTPTFIHASKRVYLKGIATNLKANDPLLIDFGTGSPEFFRVDKVARDPVADRTMVTLQVAEVTKTPVTPILTDLGVLLEPLLKAPSLQSANSLRLKRDPATVFASKADTGLQLLTTFHPNLSASLPTALANAKVTDDNPIRVYALRMSAPLFGNNAPLKPVGLDDNTKVMKTVEWIASDVKASEEPSFSVVYLDASYDKILPDSWVIVDTGAITSKTEVVKPAHPPILIAKAKDAKASLARAAYGISGKTTLVELADPKTSFPTPWIKFEELPAPAITAVAISPTDQFQIIRRTIVHAQSEDLTLAEGAIEAPIGLCQGDPTEGKQIELDGLYHGLESGRWLIISGERLIEGTSGIRASELVMFSGVTQDAQRNLPGDKTQSTLLLANKLAYCYKRDTVTIYGNVVKATHGETRSEVLGGGDGSKALQRFSLRQSPLTYLAAPTPAGAVSTLQVRVNDILWHEMESLDALGPTNRNFITRTDDQDKTTVIFGNGKQGARPPTGVENVKAVYRTGIGKPGNVKAEQISLLATKPLGVKSVINPLRASGGADKESRDQARRNGPLAVMALDRLVSVKDYEDFARTYAGIGKASAARLSDGHLQLVHLTIAGADDIPIDENSDLYRNLTQVLRQFGDPFQPIQVKTRELMLLVISAKVRLQPDYQWESVAPKIRAGLLDAFSFERRELGQSVFLSEVISAIQQVAGVGYVDVDVLDSVSETEATTPGQLAAKLSALVAAASQPDSRPKPFIYVRKGQPLSQAKCGQSVQAITTNICPAQLAFLSPHVPDTLILTELTA